MTLGRLFVLLFLIKCSVPPIIIRIIKTYLTHHFHVLLYIASIRLVIIFFLDLQEPIIYLINEHVIILVLG